LTVRVSELAYNQKLSHPEPVAQDQTRDFAKIRT